MPKRAYAICPSCVFLILRFRGYLANVVGDRRARSIKQQRTLVVRASMQGAEENMSYLKEGMTRRQAIALMGFGGAAAALSLAGCAPQQQEASENSGVADGSVPEKPANQEPTEYAQYDVIIVGGGGGGLSAALAAGYLGAESIALFEKSVAVGGNSLMSHGSVTVPKLPDYAKPEMTPELQKYLDDILEGGPLNESEERWWSQLLAEYDDYRKNGDTGKVFDSALFNSIDYARKDEITVEQELVFYERLPEFYDWILEQTGIQLKIAYGGSGYPWPRTTSVEGSLRGEGWIDGLNQCIEKNGYPVEVKLSTPVTSLITDEDGNVVGVFAEKVDGGRVAAFAKRGVVLACGGFTANRDMLQQYNMEWPFTWMKGAMTDGSAALTGDGVLMSQAIGGTVAQMNRIQCLTQCDAKTGAENTLVGDRSKTLLRVNYQGKRFKSEDASRNEMTRAILALPEKCCLQISDKNNALVENGVNHFGVPISTLEELGTLFVADTIDKLGEAFGADPKAFSETVANFNKYCDDQNDQELGNTLIGADCKIVEPPFYAYSIAPAVHITYGGLVVDEDFKVVKYDQEQTIEGLYSIGDCRDGAGGFDIALPDGYFVAKHLMRDVDPVDRSAAMEAAKEAEAAEDQAAAAASAAASVSTSYKEGSYTGTGNGMGGEINVTLEVSDSAISVVDISPNKETVGIGGYEAIEDGTFAKLIEDAQGPNFDAISGATITSSAIQTAVSEALESAAK